MVARAVLPSIATKAVEMRLYHARKCLSADSLAAAVRGDSEDILPPKVSQRAEELAKAKDLQTARAAFRDISESLIQYLKEHRIPPGTYHEAYCPMAKASWLQTGTTIANPYLGKEMPRCGQFRS